MNRPRFLFLASILLILGLVPLAARPAPEGKEDLPAKVAKLVDQLADPDLDKQVEAETALIKLGPDVLALLPGPDAKLKPEQLKRVQTVRSTLREALAQKDLAPRKCTIQNQAISLNEALAQLAKQTGVTVEDRRQDKKEIADLKLDFEHHTFWQALDAIARAADLRVSVYEAGAKIALRDGPYKEFPTSYSGLFRITAEKLVSVRDLGTDGHFTTVHLEIAWEPKFQALFFETKPAALEAKDNRGVALKVFEGGSGRAAVANKLATEIPIRLEAPPRAATSLGLNGSFVMVGPSKMLTFTYDNLAQIGKEKNQEAKKIQDGVTVHLNEFSSDDDLWTFGLALEYPKDGPDFESFESWLVHNQLLLEKNGKSFPANGGYESDTQGHRARLKYRFIEDENKGFVLGKPADWKLVYKTPGRMVRVPVKFEFKGLKLP